MTRVYIHGIGHSGSVWSALVGHPCPDLPGHGRAPRVRQATVEAFAASLLPDLPDKPVLIGHSLGGMVALQLAAQLGEDCRALVLLDAPIRLPFAYIPRSVETVSRLVAPQLFSKVAGMRVKDRVVRERIRRSLAGMSPGALRDAALAASFFDGRPLLKAVKAPILGVYDRTSPIAGPIAAHFLKTAREDAEIAWATGGHMFHLDDWPRWNRKINQFLARDSTGDGTIRKP